MALLRRWSGRVRSGFSEPAETTDVTLSGTVSDVVYLGDHIKCSISAGLEKEIFVHLDAAAARPSVGERVNVGWPARAAARRQRLAGRGEPIRDNEENERQEE